MGNFCKIFFCFCTFSNTGNNQLTGTIPTTIGMLTLLNRMYDFIFI